MASPPSKRLLTIVDVPGAPAWLERLLGPINAFIQPVADALARGLTFRENFTGEVREVLITPPPEWLVVPFASGSGWGNVGADPVLFPVFQWRKGLDGRVYTRGRFERAAGVPAAGSAVATVPVGWAPPGREYFRVRASAGASAEFSLSTDGILRWETGSATAVSAESELQWDSAPGPSPRWTTPAEIRLGAKGTPFPGRPGQVLVLGCRQRLEPTAPAVVQALDWTAHALDDNTPAIRIHRVWGLVPGVAYSLQLLILPE